MARWCVAIVILGGCADDVAPDLPCRDCAEPLPCPDPPGRPVVELGTGQETFEPIADGDAVPFYPGPQGGHHLFVSVRAVGLALGARDFEPDDPIVTVGVLVDDQQLSIFEEHPRVFRETAEGAEIVGQLIVLSDPYPPRFDGHPAALSVDVRDRCGGRASDARDVVLQLVPL